LAGRSGASLQVVGQPIVIENKLGAATNLSADLVAKAPVVNRAA